MLAELGGDAREKFLQPSVFGVDQNLRMFAQNSERGLGDFLQTLPAEQPIQIQILAVQNEAEHRFPYPADERDLAFFAHPKESPRIRQHQSARARKHTAENQFGPVAHPLGSLQITAGELSEPS